MRALPGPDTQGQDSRGHRNPKRPQAPARTKNSTGARQTGRRPRHRETTSADRTKAREHSSTPSTRSPGAEPAPNDRRRIASTRGGGRQRPPGPAPTERRTEGDRREWPCARTEGARREGRSGLRDRGAGAEGEKRGTGGTAAFCRPEWSGRSERPERRVGLPFSRRPVVKCCEQAGGQKNPAPSGCRPLFRPAAQPRFPAPGRKAESAAQPKALSSAARGVRGRLAPGLSARAGSYPDDVPWVLMLPDTASHQSPYSWKAGCFLVTCCPR